jgi:hypothetical protein
MFRDTSTSNFPRLDIYSGDGTATIQHQLVSPGTGGSAGDANICQAAGNLKVGSGTNPADVVLHNGCKVITGTGSPEGAVTAPVGSMYTRADGGAGTTLYIKESGTGNTGWVAK